MGIRCKSVHSKKFTNSEGIKLLLTKVGRGGKLKFNLVELQLYLTTTRGQRVILPDVENENAVGIAFHFFSPPPPKKTLMHFILRIQMSHQSDTVSNIPSVNYLFAPI